MTRTLWLVLGLALACNCESAPGPAGSPLESVVPAGRPETVDVRQTMRAHHQAAKELQVAITQGRLTSARDLAAWIGTNANPRTDELLTAAYQIEQARDLAAAADLTGDLAGACGSCHLERGVRPRLTSPPEPPALPGIKHEMARHQWAAALLWDGVIGPDDLAWLTGARVMATATIDFSATTHDKPNPEVVGYGETLRMLAIRAGETTDHTGRAVLYSEMLQNCVGCHAIVRPRAVAWR